MAAGYQVKLFAIGGLPEKAPATKACQAYRDAGGKIADVSELYSQRPVFQLVVDAIFGSGLNRAVTGEALSVIEYINATASHVIALDIPSGLNADTGVKLPDAVRARETVTFIARKFGLYTGDAKNCCGKIIYADLQVDSKLLATQTPVAWLMDIATFQPERTALQNSHKGDYGHVLVVGGDYGMAGAVRLSGEAAMRCGAGAVSVATHAEHAVTLSAACPVLMAHGVSDAADLAELSNRSDVIVLGPGLGKQAWGRALFSYLIETPQAKIIDADGLNLLAAEPMYCDDWILTPHPGEAARLLGTDSRTVQNSRLQASQEIVRRFGGICVLKGAGTIVCSAEQAIVCPLGSVAMATAGMGDVLSGVIAAVLAQIRPQKAARTTSDNTARNQLQTAAVRGVYLHAEAARQAAGPYQRGLLASDLMPHLAEQFKNICLYRV